MRPMRDQITPALIFQGLPMAFNPNGAKGINGRYRFDITGENGGSWTVAIKDGTCEITSGSADFDWRFELDTDTFIGMTTGDFMGQEAFMLGRVTVEGDPILGMAFDQAFTPDAA
jgi:putative sterol carrier protein